MKSVLRSPTKKRFSQWTLCAIVGATALIAGCGGGGSGWNGGPAAGGGNPPTAIAALECDNSIAEHFKSDDQTTVLLVKRFNKGDPFILEGAATPATTVATNEVCLVKLNVGPGNPGPAGAPSTSKGIGIHVWLPTKANWNGRFHATGNGGWGGSSEGTLTGMGTGASTGGLRAPDIASSEGAVTASEDMGHFDPMATGSFAMNPDGTINKTLWEDFSVRSVHEMALKAKALAKAYYGSAPKYSYFDAASTGGRQGLQSAQAYPEDFDGIVSGVPAINWTRFTTAEVYPQIVWLRDLVDKGIPIPSLEQMDFVSNAAINACDLVGGKHLGFILDTDQCRYDPTRDANALCAGVAGQSPVIGASTSTSCVNLSQAQAFNKIWYGPTADGSVPDPAVDNGMNATLQGVQKWYGLPRGTSFYQAEFLRQTGIPFGLANPASPFSIGTDMLALELQNPSVAGPNFKNATGNGAEGWRTLSYADFANAFDRGVALQDAFARINTDNPDLSAFKNRGGKLLHYHGVNDELIFSMGSVNYYNRVLAQMGGLENVKSFYRFYRVPGNGHGSVNATSNANASPPTFKTTQVYDLLTKWVEGGAAPDRIDLTSIAGSAEPIGQPICPYPQKATYKGGDAFVAGSYACE